MSSTKDTEVASKPKKKVISRKVLEELRARQLRRRRIVLIAAAGILLTVALILCYSFGVYEQLLDWIGVERDISVTPTATKIAYVPRGTPTVGSTKDCIIIYDENGVTGLTPAGEWKWNVAYSVETPVMKSYASFLLLCDYGNKTILAFDGNGLRWRYDAEMPIVGCFASDVGDHLMVLCSQKDFATSATYFTCDEKEIKEVFTRKFGTYYMIAGAAGKNQAQLALSGVYASGGAVTGAITFLRARDGEVFTTEIADGETYPLVDYLNDDTVFVANPDGLRLMRKSGTASEKSDMNKKLWSRDGGRTAIADMVCVGDEHCVVAFRTENADESTAAKSSLAFYDAAGKTQRNVDIEGSVLGLASRDDTVVAYTANAVYMFNEQGNQIGVHRVSSDIQQVSYMDARNVVLVCGQDTLRISFEA